MGENAHPSPFNSTAQYSNYLAIINPHAPEVQAWNQIVCSVDPVICSGTGSPN